MQGFLFNCNNMSRLLLIQYCDESRCAGSRAEGFQGARAEARPLIAVFGMSAATKQNGKLIDRKNRVGLYVHACVFARM